MLQSRGLQVCEVGNSLSDFIVYWIVSSLCISIMYWLLNAFLCSHTCFETAPELLTPFVSGHLVICFSIHLKKKNLTFCSMMFSLVKFMFILLNGYVFWHKNSCLVSRTFFLFQIEPVPCTFLRASDYLEDDAFIF